MRRYKSPSVDIVLCCYNQEEFIVQAIESVISQKFIGEARVIIADDCSTDRTLEIIKSYEDVSPFPFVYFRESANMGYHANYKRAFGSCLAEYIAVLEGDDWWNDSSHLEQHLHFLELHPRYSMSFNTLNIFHQDSARLVNGKWHFGDIDHVRIRLKHQLAYGNQLGNLSACVFRSKFLQQIPDSFFNLSYADWELGIMMAQKGPIALLRDPTSTYRINSRGQWSSLTEEEKSKSECETLESIKPYLPRHAEKYIEQYRSLLENKEPVPFPMPFQYRVKSFLRSIIG